MTDLIHPKVEKDLQLIEKLLSRQEGAWNEFVDQFLPVVYKVIHHTAVSQRIHLLSHDVEDIAADVMLNLVADDYAVLRRFEGRSKLATYLTVITRRICIHLMMKKWTNSTIQLQQNETILVSKKEGWDSADEVQELLKRLPRRVRLIMMLHYLEGRTYEEISKQLKIPVNTIGPIISRAKDRLSQRIEDRAQIAKGRQNMLVRRKMVVA